METIHRVGFLPFVLVIGISLGILGLRLTFMIMAPLFILQFMSRDKKHYTHTRKQQQAGCVYHKFP